MNPDDAYKPQLRLTVERKGFGGGSSYSQSYEGGNPDEVGDVLFLEETPLLVIKGRSNEPRHRISSVLTIAS